MPDNYTPPFTTTESITNLVNLLKAHKVMMADLVKESGTFRSRGVGVYAGTELIHAGTPPQYVPDLMRQLFAWLKESKLHPLERIGANRNGKWIVH